jgi:hypothetical protein
MLAITVPGSSTYGSSVRGVALEKMSRSVCCEKKGLAGVVVGPAWVGSQN